MKAAVCAILLPLNLCQGEALKCNYCFSKGSDFCTPTSVQTCSRRTDACAAVIFQGARSSTFRQCMNMIVCQSYMKTPGGLVNCCSTDLCN